MRNKVAVFLCLLIIFTKAGVAEDRLHLVLANGLRVFLVSDPNALTSTGAMSVQAGSWDDPAKFPGMAHFVEHLLFLGSEAYPIESDYMHYIQERGGGCNAITHRDHTVYGFSIQTGKLEQLEEALDRFSHFFIDPLFTESSVGREMHAIHHEFEDNLENEFFRVWRVFKEIGNPLHPNAQFSCGNLESLAEIKRSDILDWFKKYYRPSSMRLVLVSNEPLEELVRLSHELFGRIPDPLDDKPPKHEGYFQPMTSTRYEGHIVHLDSAFKGRLLSLIWEVPKKLVKNEDIGAFELIETVLNHGYRQGLSSILREKGFANDMKVEFWRIDEEHAIFRINVALTTEGVKDYEEVIKDCFQALSFIRMNPIPEYLFDQLKRKKEERNFSASYQETMQIAASLIREYQQVVLSFPETLFEISSLLSGFRANNCFYFLVSPSQESGVISSQTEKWMGTKYLIRKIPIEKIEFWDKQKSHEQMRFQPQEEFVPTKEFVYEGNIEIEKALIPDPAFIVDNEIARIRLMESPGYSDRVEAFFCLTTPMFGGGIKNTALYEIFVDVVKNRLEEEFEKEPVSLTFGAEQTKICVFLSVPKKDAAKYFYRFFSLIHNSKISRLEFEKKKEYYLLTYDGDPDPMECANQLLDSLLAPSFYYTKMELYQNMVQLFYEDYEEFEEKAFSHVFIEGTFFGSLKAPEALEIWQELYRAFPFQPYKSDIKENKHLLFNDRLSLLLHQTHRRGHALLLLVAAHATSEKSQAIQNILSIALKADFFKELRTKEQMAYKLYNWTRLIHKTICHGFSIQSSTKPPYKLLQMIEDFLDSYGKNITQILTRERVDLIRDTQLRKLEQEKDLADKEEDKRVLARNIYVLKQLTYEEIVDAAAVIFSRDQGKKMGILIEGSGEFSWDEKFSEVFEFVVDKNYFR